MNLKSKCLLLSVMVCGALFAQDVPGQDTTYKSKTLDNGFTYYIKKNSFPENRASLRLYVGAGSLHETDQQQGLAHFLEHMLFRGSENFEDWEVINFLESIGAKFGPDTNAYTAFDRTVYMLELPLEKEGVLEKGVLICSDWASSAKIEDHLVEKERAVVADEYNLNMKQCTTRQSKKIFDTFFGKSLYNRRWPIGQKEIILNCDPQLIRDFYKKWYRADRMAFVAVGDFDEEVVEKLIVENFSKLKKPTEELVEPDTSLFLPEDSHFEVYQDDEQSINIGMLLSLLDLEAEDGDEPKEITRAGIERSVYKSIFLKALSQRLEKLAKTHPAPFADHFPMNLDIGRIGIRSIGFVPFEDRPYEGMTALLREIVRILTFGPSSVEFEEIVESLKQDMQNEIANSHRIHHATLAHDLIDHYVDGSPVYSHLDRLEYKFSILEEVTREKLIEWLKESKLEPYRHIIYEVNRPNLVTSAGMQKEVEAWLKEDIVNQEEVEFVELREVEQTDFEETLLEKKVDEKYGFTTLRLNNGMKVILQPTDLEKDEINLVFFARGGKAALDPELFSVADLIVGEYVLHSGFANFNGDDLQRYFARKNIGINFALHMNQRSLSLSSTKRENLSDLFSLAHGIFYERKRDEAAWNSLISRYSEAYKNQENSPQFYFNRFMIKHFYNDNPMFAVFNPENASEEGASKVADYVFSDPSHFTLLVIGDFDIEEGEKLALDFLGKEGKVANSGEVKSIVDSYPKKDEDITLYRGKEVACVNHMFYAGPFSYGHKNEMMMTAAAFDHIVSHRLLEKIRKEMGDTYSIRIGTGFPQAPNYDSIFMSVYFGCEPEKADRLKQRVKEQLALFLEEGPTDEEIETAKEILLEKTRLSLLFNGGHANAHMTAEVLSKEISDILEYAPNIERQVSKERIEEFAKAAFKQVNLTTYTLKSEDQE